MALDNNGNIFTTGFFIGKTIFYLNNDSVTYNAGNQDVFIQKLDKNGDFQWAKKIGGTGIDQGHAIAVGPDGDVVITGQFKSSTMSLNPDPNAVNPKKVSNAGTRYDIFFVKLKGVDGEYVWGHGFYGGLDDYGRALAIDKDGYIYLAGEIAQSVNFELDASKPGKTKQSKGGLDVFLARYNKDGNIDWVETYGSTGVDFVRAIVVNSDFEIVIGGGFSGTVDLDHTSGTRTIKTKNTSYDGFCLKINETPEVNAITKNKRTSALSAYPNPAHNTIALDLPTVQKVCIISMQGKVLLKESNSKTLNIESLPVGMYIIQATDNEQTYTSRFIKN